VATYLSPHLHHPRERILDGLAPLADATLDGLVEELEPLAREHRLTYFEFMTLACFVWAAREKVDFLVLEVGLGGRLDATNVTRPLACAITTIDYDHMEYLGNSLEEILDEKMGVLRPESLVFTALRDPKLIDRLEARCLELDAIAYYAHQIRTEIERVSWNGQNVRLNGYPFTLTNPSVGTVENAALAFLLMRIVFPKIAMATLQRGFAKVVTPARMEMLSENPRVVLSGDHNAAGMRCLLETLDRMQVPKEKLRVVCGLSPDKPFREMYSALAARSQDILLTQVARLADKMPADYSSLGAFEPDACTAVRRMRELTARDETLLVTGSLYLAGEVRPLWRPEVVFRRESDTAR
jgi:dihydrofolate synthase/folylpolyglutamate synthase